MIDCYEFFRALAWEDIEQVEDSFAEAKIQKSSIAAVAKERLTTLFGRSRYDACTIINTQMYVHDYLHLCISLPITHALQTGRQGCELCYASVDSGFASPLIYVHLLTPFSLPYRLCPPFLQLSCD